MSHFAMKSKRSEVASRIKLVMINNDFKRFAPSHMHSDDEVLRSLSLSAIFCLWLLRRLSGLAHGNNDVMGGRNMTLRDLQPKDAPGILSWMKDPAVNCFFRFSGDAVTLASVEAFIEKSKDKSKNLHLAIVDDNDTYMGTISLKEIDTDARNAEYAISTCSHVHGKGVAFDATREILRIAFEDLHLHRVYLNVLEENERANHFYLKCGFVYEGQFREHVFIRGTLKNINWYSMLASEFISK
jgi:RimJ/RimL family protein N-acetyltransferase